MTKDRITALLAQIPDPVQGGDLVASGALQRVSTCETYTSLRLNLPPAPPHVLDAIAAESHRALHAGFSREGERLDSLIVEFVDHSGSVVHTRQFGGTPMPIGAGRPPTPAATPAPTPAPTAPTASSGHAPIGGLSAPKPGTSPTPQSAAASLPGVKHIIAVGAGKGGVGKSSVAVNLAVGLARRGHSVGLLDGDIYGPSLPTMLNLGALDQAVLQGNLQPFLVHGIKAITIGKLVDADKPLIWRGPMAHGAFKQLTHQTNWGELDYLIIDLPPGTGDISLTMAQLLQLRGAVIVCTPQRVAQDDAVRATKMFQQLGIDILGVVENMSHFVGDDGKLYDIFGKGGAEMMAQRLGVPFLGSVPITMNLRKNSDAGNPTANFTGNDALSAALESLVNTFESQVALSSMKQGQSRPALTIS